MSGAAAFAAFQRALAALLHDPAARAAHARAPEAWTAAQGLSGRYARILEALPPSRLDRFRDAHRRERASLLRALFPLTFALAPGAPLLERHLDAHPFPAPRRATEAARFHALLREAFPARAARDAALRDLAAYEAALAELRALDPPTTAPPAAPPADDAPLGLAPHVRVLETETDLPSLVDALLEGRPAAPRLARGWVVLRRDPEVEGGVLSAALDEPDARLLLLAARGATLREARAALGEAEAARLQDMAAEGVVAARGDA